MILSCGQEDRVFPMLYIASYNELEQLHMQVLLKESVQPYKCKHVWLFWAPKNYNIVVHVKCCKDIKRAIYLYQVTKRHSLWVGAKRLWWFKSNDALACRLISFVTALLPPPPSTGGNGRMQVLCLYNMFYICILRHTCVLTVLW